jgi:hypothetical protein
LIGVAGFSPPVFLPWRTKGVRDHAHAGPTEPPKPYLPNRTGASRARSLILNAMEHFFTCPYCWQRISFVLDPSVTEQTYVEDCEVCCRPIEVRYAVEEGEVSEFEARALE